MNNEPVSTKQVGPKWQRKSPDLERLAWACELIDPEEEKRLADEGLAEDIKDWPEY